MHSSPPSELIDVHSHIYPEAYLRHLESRREIPRVTRRGAERFFAIFPGEVGADGAGGRPMGPQFWSLDEKLAYMDANGIDRSVVSLGNPWLNPLPDAAGDALAREVNRSLAALSGGSGGRLIGMGALPAGSVDAAVAELDFIAGERGLVGVGAGPKIAGLALDDARLDPFWAALVGNDLPLFLHPENGAAADDLQGYGHALLIGTAFPMETTVAISRLVFGGVLERFPDLRILAAHGGGTLPFLAGRMDAAWRSDPAMRERLPQPPSEYLRRLWFDGLVYYGPALRALLGLAGEGRILFGTDHPFSVADPQRNIRMLDEELSGEALVRARGGSAREFFKL